MYVVPRSMENYIGMTFRIGNSKLTLKFIDSYRFLSASLDTLASLLPNNKNQILREHSPDDNQFRLLTRKGVYPYEYMKSWDNLEEEELPRKEDFKSTLNDTEIADSDYEHVQNIWREFALENLGQLSDLYLKTDVLLLNATLKNFRRECLNIYGLDPFHFYTTPGFSWAAMFKQNPNLELDIIKDPEILNFLIKRI